MKDKPSPKIISEALIKFIDSSKENCITIDKIKQLRKDCNTTYKNCLEFIDCSITIRFIESYNNVYLLAINSDENKYILKFDNFDTIIYLSDEFDFCIDTVSSIVKHGYTDYDYDEHEVIQNNLVYNTIMIKPFDYDYIDVYIVDKETRILAFYIITNGKNISVQMEKFATKRFKKIKRSDFSFIKESDLPTNIKEYVLAQITLVNLKG